MCGVAKIPMTLFFKSNKKLMVIFNKKNGHYYFKFIRICCILNVYQ